MNIDNNKLSIFQKNYKVILLFILKVICLSAAYPVLASEFSSVKPTSVNTYNHWIRATEEELAQQRGGFVLPNGMTIDFSLERIVFLNGIETHSSFFQLPENGYVLQNGSENLAQDPIAGLGNIIQNHLDDQVIRTLNEINIEIGNLQNIGFENNNGHGSLELILPILH